MKSRGLALSVVILIALMVMTIAGAALSLGYNLRLLAKKSVSGRTAAFYYAKAGMVDAFELIRKDATGEFADPAFNPPAYEIDVNGDGTADAAVDISARSVTTRRRTIQVTGKS